MLGTKKLSWIFSVIILLAAVAPAFAGDRDVAVRDLKGISPHRHRYIFSVIGGAAAGAGLGALVGGAPNIEKGILIGAGGMSAIYLHSHRSTAGEYRDWAFIASHAALGTGLGWTICGCNKGALAGGLVTGGASAIWRAVAPQRGILNASHPNNNRADLNPSPDNSSSEEVLISSQDQNPAPATTPASVASTDTSSMGK